MTIDFTCQKCEASFELDSHDLLDGTEKLACPHCEAKAPGNGVDDFNAALTEMLAQVAALSKRFAVTLSIETEDLGATAAAKVEDDEEEDEESDDDDEESDDDELDFDEGDADESDGGD